MFANPPTFHEAVLAAGFLVGLVIIGVILVLGHEVPDLAYGFVGGIVSAFLGNGTSSGSQVAQQRELMTKVPDAT